MILILPSLRGLSSHSISSGFLKNISILGGPGSGKGFYGKPLAQHLRIPLITVSSILRKDPDLLEHLDSGALVDCQRVCSVLHDFLLVQEPGGFMLDGFPRTLLQIKIMQDQWPETIQIKTAFHVDVPDFVCETKMIGRRSCKFCDRPINVGAVHRGGFDLPALFPQEGECMDRHCHPGVHWWTKRKDDSDHAIVQERLRLHHEHEQPILDHYKQMGGLFAYTPKRGAPDIPDMQQSFQAWLVGKEN